MRTLLKSSYPNPEFPMEFSLADRRDRIARAIALSGEVLLIGAGEPIGIPGGADQCYRFLAHAEYFYLTDREIAGAVLAFDPSDGWTHFVPEVTERERIWEGRSDPEPGTEPLPSLAAWLGARRAKDAGEIARIRRAVEATAAGYGRVSGLVRPGVSERELQVELEAEFFRNGADRTC